MSSAGPGRCPQNRARDKLSTSARFCSGVVDSSPARSSAGRPAACRPCRARYLRSGSLMSAIISISLPDAAVVDRAFLGRRFHRRLSRYWSHTNSACVVLEVGRSRCPSCGARLPAGIRCCCGRAEKAQHRRAGQEERWRSGKFVALFSLHPDFVALHAVPCCRRRVRISRSRPRRKSAR